MYTTAIRQGKWNKHDMYNIESEINEFMEIHIIIELDFYHKRCMDDKYGSFMTVWQRTLFVLGSFVSTLFVFMRSGTSGNIYASLLCT